MSVLKHLFRAAALLAISVPAAADGVSKKTASTNAYCAGVRWGELLEATDKSQAMKARVQQSNDLMQAGIEQAVISQHDAQSSYDRGIKDARACRANSADAACQRTVVECP